MLVYHPEIKFCESSKSKLLKIKVLINRSTSPKIMPWHLCQKIKKRIRLPQLCQPYRFITHRRVTDNGAKAHYKFAAKEQYLTCQWIYEILLVTILSMVYQAFIEDTIILEVYIHSVFLNVSATYIRIIYILRFQSRPFANFRNQLFKIENQAPTSNSQSKKAIFGKIMDT